jgi:putative FmdB family regulatory protein
MPIYEYLCSKCGEKFEKIQKFSDAPVEVHDGCGGTVEKLISTSALQFKGSGFYITDYAKGGSSPKPSGDSKSESKGESESKSESKGDSKSEGKSESKSGESQSSKSSESKSDSKSSDSSSSKSSESKPAPATKSD